MVFASMLFVFCFLTANLISQIVLKTPRAKNIAMLVFSMIFYSWGGPRYLFLLLAMVAICWVGGLQVQKREEGKERKLVLILTIALCLAILGVFKYTGFVCATFQGIFGVPEHIPNIVLPIGISFYTFQLISYVVDVYRKEVAAQEKYWVLLLYASLFHQCIAGPIVRYQDIHQDIIRRRATPAEISRGVSRFTVGLAKKAILANGCAAVADTFFEVGAAELAAVPALGILLAAFAFTLQIYLDFSAYSDMAIGMGLMCGFHYKENFNYPYLSTSIGEFWRRWHISLGSFFRDYVYIPLGGNRCAVPRQVLNLFVVWFLTGLWHGASWNFVLWGLYFGLLIGLERFLLKDKLDKIPLPLKGVGVFILVLFSWILFKFTDFELLGIAVKGLFGLNGNGFTGAAVGLALKNNLFFLIFSTIACFPIGRMVRNILGNLSRKNTAFFWVNAVWEAAHPALLLLLSAMALAGDSYNPFLYFQF
ncbi:MAG: MBOAT family protein [Ruminiclostridium sp.]|nr:MBOAT family protein [Ruminiclostridium sp.]